jgi:hypothetical protein
MKYPNEIMFRQEIIFLDTVVKILQRSFSTSENFSLIFYSAVKVLENPNNPNASGCSVDQDDRVKN